MAIAATTFGGLLDHATRPKQTVILVQVCIASRRVGRRSRLCMVFDFSTTAREEMLRTCRHAHNISRNTKHGARSLRKREVMRQTV